MRYVVLCGVLFAMTSSAVEPVVSPEPQAHRTFVGLLPVAMGKGLLAVDSEWVESQKHSVRLGTRLAIEVRDLGGGSATRSRLHIGIEQGFRYYLTGTALNGLWVGPHLELSLQGVGAGSVLPEHWGYSGGVGTLIGYSRVMFQGLTMQAGVGLGVSYAFGHTVQLVIVPGPDGRLEQQIGVIRFQEWSLTERATLAVGWAF
jgi:hypothetical protein